MKRACGRRQASRSPFGSQAYDRPGARRRPRSWPLRVLRRQPKDAPEEQDPGFPACRDKGRRSCPGGAPVRRWPFSAPRPLITRGRRADHNLDRFGNRRAIGHQHTRTLRCHPFIEHELRRHRRAQNVGRNFDVTGAGLAHVAERMCDGLIELSYHLIGNTRCARGTGHGTQNIDVRNVLKGSMFACGRDVQPPIKRTGARARDALQIAVTVFVTPGRR